MNNALYKFLGLLTLVFVWSGAWLSAGELQGQKISPYMLLTYLKDTDSHKILQVKMTNITQTGEVPLPGLLISFYNDESLLGTVTTNVAGDATFTIDSAYGLVKGEDGSWPFRAVFDGDTLVDEVSGELSITDVNLEMILNEVEGKKSIKLTATLPSEKGTVPVAGEEIGIYVPRMFSLLPVSTGILGDDGTIELSFPDDLPGDSIGNLTVIGRFNDHFLFGNVEKREIVPWGTAVVKPPPVYRSLWSTLAPKWMIVTLAIMLIGVWGHYTYVIISLIRIKRDSLKNKKNSI